MSVEKIPQMAANSASVTKGGGGVKNERDAGSAGGGNDLSGVFGALLSTLGVDDARPSAAAGPLSSAADDQSTVDLGTGSTPIAVFTPTVQAPVAVIKGGSADDLANRSVPNIQALMGGALVSDSVELIAADGRPAGGIPAVKMVSLPIGQSGLTDIPDALRLSNFAAKAARLQAERGRGESALPAAVVRTSAVIAEGLGKLESRAVGERADVLGSALAQFPAQVLPLGASQQTEFRRDKAIFKENSTHAASDVGMGSSLDARLTNLSLESMAPDVGAGMTQGDQNPGAYWMSGDMKNAEMKLDGFGESPVEVSISVHGNQTHVAFRTDEIQTRLALEDAGATLKDMLSKEGLDLMGVSVGTSGSGGDGAQGRRPRADSGLAQIDNLNRKLSSGTSGHIVTSKTGKLDVFV